MMNDSGGWMGGWAHGGVWTWTIGALVVVLLVFAISKVARR